MIKSPSEFYDQVSSFYDDMTRFQKRQDREREWFRRWRDRFPFDSALDAGCGTGSHSFALLREGVKTVGIDISAQMISEAQKHASRFGIGEARFIQSSFEQLSGAVSQKFDVVFCLGNSLAHLEPRQSLPQALREFSRVLHPGGRLIIQLLNYEKILSQKQRIIDIYREGAQEFIRFYDFHEKKLNFNILHVDWSGEAPKHELQTTLHYPLRRRGLQGLLAQAGLQTEVLFGNIIMETYDPSSSPNLVLVARKGN